MRRILIAVFVLLTVALYFLPNPEEAVSHFLRCAGVVVIGVRGIVALYDDLCVSLEKRKAAGRPTSQL